MGNTHVTNTLPQQSSIHAVLQFAYTYQRDNMVFASQRPWKFASKLRTTQNNSEPLRTIVRGGFLYVINKKCVRIKNKI